jgi:hypothetical protein
MDWNEIWHLASILKIMGANIIFGRTGHFYNHYLEFVQIKIYIFLETVYNYYVA